MEIGKFFLRDFRIDNEFDQRGGEAIVSRAQHPRLGYTIFKIFYINYFSEVAIKRWTSKAYNVGSEIELMIRVKNYTDLNEFDELELWSPKYCSISWNIDEGRIKMYWLYNAVHVYGKSS